MKNILTAYKNPHFPLFLVVVFFLTSITMTYFFFLISSSSSSFLFFPLSQNYISIIQNPASNLSMFHSSLLDRHLLHYLQWWRPILPSPPLSSSSSSFLFFFSSWLAILSKRGWLDSQCDHLLHVVWPQPPQIRLQFLKFFELCQLGFTRTTNFVHIT